METESPQPCPVCGAPAETGSYRLKRGGFVHYVTCSSEYECLERPVTNPHPTVAEAIAAWNRGETI